MTQDERSEMQHVLTLMLAEINRLYHQFGGTLAQHELNLSYRHLNRAAIEINRLPVEIALRENMGVAFHGTTIHPVGPNS